MDIKNLKVDIEIDVLDITKEMDFNTPPKGKEEDKLEVDENEDDRNEIE